MTKNTLNIGLFGYGTVGSGLFYVLEKGKTKNVNIKKIAIRDPKKERNITQEIFTTNPDDILEDPEINLVVELIDDAEASYKIVTKALKNGKSVVSANKKMIAENFPELIQLQKEHNVALLYDASACGSIPVVRNLEEYYDNDLLTSIIGILNGSSNYILSKLFKENCTYQEALKQAQDLGFAESNPALDVNGYDALYKSVILSVHGFGIYIHPSEIFSYGIANIQKFDIQYAKEKGLKIKLISHMLKLSDSEFVNFVIPRLTKPQEYIYNVEYEYNGVVIEGECYEKQLMFGKGAGAYPTGSAVLSDITARIHNYKYEYKKKNYSTPLNYIDTPLLEIYLRYVSEEDLKLFNFVKINETYHGKEANFVVGEISLKDLKNIDNLIDKQNIFIAFTGKISNLQQ
jgi:homoserine dehydrogenase